jgi:hypothetical protein
MHPATRPLTPILLHVCFHTATVIKVSTTPAAAPAAAGAAKAEAPKAAAAEKPAGKDCKEVCEDVTKEVCKDEDVTKQVRGALGWVGLGCRTGAQRGFGVGLCWIAQ